MRRKTLEHIMIDKDITGRKLAMLVGVHPTTISKIISGENEPSLKVAYKIAKALDKTIEELFFPGE